MRYLKLKDIWIRPFVVPPVFRTVLTCFAIHSVIVFGAAMIAGDRLMLNPGGFVNPLLPSTYPTVDRFIKWDAHWYTYIAQTGYSGLSIVFFPMLILLIKAMVIISGLGYGLTGFLVCNIFGFISFGVMYALFRLDFPTDVSNRALMSYAVMPTSIYVNSIYTEPIFLTFALACAYYARLGKWWHSGLFAGMAALTRNIGVFLVLLMAYELWEKYRQQRPSRGLPFSSVAIVLPALAFGGFLVYNFLLLGNPLAFISAQKAWGRVFSPPWLNIWNGIIGVIERPEVGSITDIMMVLLGMYGLVLISIKPRFNIPKSYLLIGWSWFLIPLFSSTPWMPLYSMSRFVLVIFPLYLCIAQVPLRTYRYITIISAAGLALCSVLFTNWYWIS